LEDQDSERLGKGGTITKDLQINHLKNASIRTHSGKNPKEPMANVRVIWTIEHWN
jgi:hypothetical protein